MNKLTQFRNQYILQYLKLFQIKVNEPWYLHTTTQYTTNKQTAIDVCLLSCTKSIDKFKKRNK